MACSSDRSRQIGDLAGGHLDRDQSAELLDHLEACAACGSELALVTRLVAAAETGDFDSSRTSLRTRLPRVLLAVAALVLAAVGLRFLIPADHAPAMISLAAVDPLPAGQGVLRSGPGASREPAYAQALERYGAGDYAAAAQLFETLLAAHPQDALVRLYLGISLMEQSEFDAARRALDGARAASSGLLHERVLWFLGHALLGAGDPESALEVFAELLAIEGDYEINARQKIAAVRAAIDG